MITSWSVIIVLMVYCFSKTFKAEAEKNKDRDS